MSVSLGIHDLHVYAHLFPSVFFIAANFSEYSLMWREGRAEPHVYIDCCVYCVMDYVCFDLYSTPQACRWWHSTFGGSALPSGGVGMFNGCQSQWGSSANGWGARYGGVATRAECAPSGPLFWMRWAQMCLWMGCGHVFSGGSFVCHLPSPIMSGMRLV